MIFLAPFGLCWGPQTSRAGLAVSMKPTSDKGLLFPACDRLQHETNHKEGQTLNWDTKFVRILGGPQRHLTWRFNLQNGLNILISSVSLLFGFKTWGSSMAAFSQIQEMCFFYLQICRTGIPAVVIWSHKTIWKLLQRLCLVYFVKSIFAS